MSPASLEEAEGSEVGLGSCREPSVSRAWHNDTLTGGGCRLPAKTQKTADRLMEKEETQHHATQRGGSCRERWGLANCQNDKMAMISAPSAGSISPTCFSPVEKITSHHCGTRTSKTAKVSDSLTNREASRVLPKNSSREKAGKSPSYL